VRASAIDCPSWSVALPANLFSKRDASTLSDPRYFQSGLARWGKGGNLNPASHRPDQPTTSITDHTSMYPRQPP
jgi:hypothetical protein